MKQIYRSNKNILLQYNLFKFNKQKVRDELAFRGCLFELYTI